MNFKVNKRINLILCILILNLILTSCGSKGRGNWLKEHHGKLNIEDINDFFGLEILDDELEGKNIILSGEIHGVAANQKLEGKLIRYIKGKTNFKYLLEEISYSGAYFINKYLETGDIEILKDVFNAWQGTYAYTKDKFKLYEELYEYNQSLPEEDRIILVGVDIEHQPKLSFDYIKDILPEEESPEKIETVINDLKHKNSVYYEDILDSLNNNREIYMDYLGDDYIGFSLVVENMKNSRIAYDARDENWNQVRDEMMYNNFEILDDNLDDGIYFGQWGMQHIFQEEFDDVDWFASRINNTEKYKGKILSINFWYDDCKQMDPSGVEYDLSFGDEMIKYHNSIGGDVNLYKLVGKDSPYNNENLNMVEGKEIVDIFQYIIVISGSEASTILEL